MYKLSVPVNINTLTDTDLPEYTETLHRTGTERIFLCGFFPFYRKDCYLYSMPDRIQYLISYFKKQGFEVGVWESSLGHGSPLAGIKSGEMIDTYQPIVGVDGVTVEGYCPLDENFVAVFAEAIRKFAKLKPDIIMLDDDYRMNLRKYTLGCCCGEHLAKMSELLGEKITREQVEEAVFTGGENRYRTAWLQVQGDSMMAFARRMREAVDSVDPNIRLGCCMCYDTWDYDGTDGIALARAFAGKTKPFLRTIGAPYHDMRVQRRVEYTRMQAAWCRGKGVEVFSEGDVYPRPRYTVPSRQLELFDLALLATDETDGILKYMLDYNHRISYEKGYTLRHDRNKPLRDGIQKMFHGKKSVGVRVFEAMHRLEKSVFPEEFKSGIARQVQDRIQWSPAQDLLCENAIPTTYEADGDYPVIVFGENARHIPEEDLKNGAILDVVAAEILQERGIDAGLVKREKASFLAERFTAEEEDIMLTPGVAVYRTELQNGAQAKTVFTPDETVASYTYENKKGVRFYVFCVDVYDSHPGSYWYFLSYHRQKHLTEAVEWLCDRPLPAACLKNPWLYMQTKRNEDEGSLAVGLYNVNADEIIDAEIVLDRSYSEIDFLNCSGPICGNTVRLSGEIEPFGFAAFSVK